jgi:hypothetical protein
MLKSPSKHLRYSETNFSGYWVQLNAVIRHNDHADQVLDGLLLNPLLLLHKLTAEEDLYETLKACYEANGYGWPPTPVSVDNDPIAAYKQFKIAVASLQEQNEAVQDWMTSHGASLDAYRAGVKFIYEKAVATLDSSESAMLVSDLNYGSGMALLHRLKNKQQRQTSIGLYTLFVSLITLQLRNRESITSLFSRVRIVRARLSSWNPPIILPDQLILVCVLRLLPREYASTRTILMSRKHIELTTAYDMLLDAENADANLISRTIGSGKPTVSNGLVASTALATQPQASSGKQPRRPRNKLERLTAKCKVEGRCKHHGERSTHASSECMHLHPELRKTKSANIATKTTAAPADVSEDPYNFMDKTSLSSVGYTTELVSSTTDPFGFMCDLGDAIAFTFSAEHVRTTLTSEDPFDFMETGTAPAADTTATPLVSAADAPATPTTAVDVPKLFANFTGHKATTADADPLPPGVTGCVWVNVQVYKGNVPGPAPVRVHIPLLLPLDDNCEGIYNHVVESADDADKCLCQGDFNVYLKVEDGYKHVGLLDTPRVLGFESRQTVCVWTHENVRARKVYGRTLGQLNDPDLESTTLEAVRGTSETVDELLIHFDTARIDGITHITGITNPAAGWTTSIDLKYTPDQVLLGFQLTQSEFDEYHGKLTANGTRVPVYEATAKASAFHAEQTTDKNAFHFMHPSPAKRNRNVSESNDCLGCKRVKARQTRTRIPSCCLLAEDWAGQQPYDPWSPPHDPRTASSSPTPPLLLAPVTAVPHLQVETSLFANARDRQPSPEVVTSSDSDQPEDSSSDDLDHLANDINGKRWPSTANAYTCTSAVSSYTRVSSAFQVMLKDLCCAMPEANESGTNGDDEDDESDSNTSNDNDLFGDTDDDSDQVEFESRDNCCDTCGNEQDDVQHAICSALAHTCVSALSTGIVASDSRPVIDSGATAHLCADKALFTSLSPVSSITGVRDITGAVTPVTGCGTVGNLVGVLLVGNAKHTLVSVGAYLDNHGGKMEFTPQGVFHNNGNTRTKLGDRAEDGLYRHAHFTTNANQAMAEACLTTDTVNFMLLRERIHRLHRCFGHAGKAKLAQILQNHKFHGLSPKHAELLTSCMSCQMGMSKKQSKPRFANPAAQATEYGERLLGDCSGRTRTASLSGSRYGLVVVCEGTKWVFGKTMRALTAVHDALKYIIEVELHQRADRTVKYWRSDGGSEFQNSRVDNLLAAHDIKREQTCRGTSFQVGLPERIIGVIFSKIRVYLYDAKLPTAFWAEGFATAIYNYNRTPGRDGKSPFERRYGRAPKVGHLRPFGTSCAINIPTGDRKGKIVAAAIPGILLGYGYVDGKKGYRVYVPTTRKVITSYNVSFSDLASSLSERRAADPHLVATSLDTTAMLDELHPSNLFQLEQEHLASPAVRARVHDTASGNGGGETYYHASDTSGHAVPRLVPASTPVNPAPAPAPTPTVEITSEPEGETMGKDTGPPAHAEPGYAYLEDDHPFFDSAGIHEQAAPGVPGPVAGRTRSARSRTNNESAHIAMYVSDCAPAYIAQAATAATDFATNHRTPKHFKEAMASPDRRHWLNAIKTELEAVKQAGTYRLVPRSSVPNGANVIGYTWVFKIKNNADGSIARYKARICVDGSKQRPGIDFEQTFAPVANATTVRLVLALAAAKGLHLKQYDVEVAFLASKIDKPVYMRVPAGAEGKPNQVWALLKSLYGLKQAPRLFNTHLNKTLETNGYKQSSLDPCLYYKFAHGEETYLAVVVDDILLATNSISCVKHFETSLSGVYKLKSLGTPAYMIGMQIGHHRDYLTICQNRYISDVAKRFGELGCTPTRTPANTAISLVRTGVARKPASSEVQPTKYRSLVGALMYAVMTRPDVATPVSICARYLQQPTQAHWDAAMRILRYLVSTPEICLTYRKSNNLKLAAYVDASWADDKDTRRSRYGYAIYLGNSLISWKSKLHACITLSTAESEYVAATEACKTVVWLRNTMHELRMPQHAPTAVYEDNQACIHMAANRMITGRNKHMELKQHYVRSLSLNKTVRLVYVNTKQQRADILTKNLAVADFMRMRELLLGNRPHEANHEPKSC